MIKVICNIERGESQMELYYVFSRWLDKHLSEVLPKGIVAFNFNLYEGDKQTYDIELVGCASFDVDDADWACDEIFTTREDLFFIPITKYIKDWMEGLSVASSFVERYLQEGKYADKLKSYMAVGIGFVDGDIEILYRSK